MFDGMSVVISSLARRLTLRRRKTKKSISGKPPFLSCGGGSKLLRFFSSGSLKKLTGKGRTTSKPLRKLEEEGREGEAGGGDADNGSCLWRHTILLGQKCQPLEFAGAIHYDSNGQRLRQVRLPPRSPLCSPVRSFESTGRLDRV